MSNPPHLGGIYPNFKWLRLTEHLYPNLNGYVENDAKKMIVLRLHVLYPFNVLLSV